MIVDERGDRRAPLLVEPAADEHPAFSPDGRWLVVASRRDRRDEGTSLWVVPAVAEASPVRLTDGPARDLDPVWTPDGRAIVFASDRGGGGDLDLYRLPIAVDAGGPRAAGPPEPLTDDPGHELAPSLAGDRLVFQLISVDPTRSVIAERLADGRIVALTDGPTDGSPALAPDGRRLAYVTPRVRADGGRDLDVVVLDPDATAGEATGLAVEATDEGAPAWSVDGRWLFATSIVRDTEGAPVLSSVIHVDSRARAPRVRMLRDRVGAIPRLGVALAPTVLDAAALAGNPDYLTALAEEVAALAAERAEAEAERARATGDR